MQIDLDYAYNFCKEIAISHYENFPVGSLLIPSDKRKYIYNIYAFARYADDIADSEKYTTEEKLKRLNDFDNELTRMQSGNFESLIPETRNIFLALSNTTTVLNIPVTEFRDLLTAFRQDAVQQRYSDFQELLEYSKYSANPIGHLVLFVFGYGRKKNKECFEYSDKVCTALQLANFWQDVSVDTAMNRIYIPGKMMNEFNYSEEMLIRKIENPDFREMIKVLVDKTEKIFIEGRPILKCVHGRLRYELKATIEGGMEILKKIRKINYGVLSERVTITNFDKLKILGKIIWK